jgi:predicted nucleotidyltransferase
VWLTGSRVRGNARPDSDWDVLVITSDAPADETKLFECNHIGPGLLGGPIEVVIAHPSHWNDARRYMTECRTLGVRLR